MIGRAGWQPLVKQWAQVFGSAPEVAQYPSPARRRGTGDWWRNGNEWCLHLDEATYVRFPKIDLEERERKLLTWALVEAFGEEQVTWRRVCTEWGLELQRKAQDGVFATLLAGRAWPENVVFDAGLPGRFIWLEIGHTGRNDRESLAVVRENILQIVDEYAPRSFVGWQERSPDRADLLLFWSVDMMEGALEELERPMGDDLPPSDTTSETDALRTAIHQLSQMIAEDAWVSCKAAAGAEVTEPAALFFGVATAVFAWKTREHANSRGDMAVVWGDNPVSILLGSLSEEAVHLLQGVIKLRSAARDVSLSTELVEALNGVIAANLNISEAARILYLHRNTLMNRIERIRAQTGYDIRHFADALVLWLSVNLKTVIE